MANVQIRLDDNLRKQAQLVAQGMGLDLSTAVRLFLTQMVRENGLPFRPVAAPLYAVKNQEVLEKAIAKRNAGKDEPVDGLEKPED